MARIVKPAGRPGHKASALFSEASPAYSQTTPKNQGKQTTGPGRTTTTCCCGCRPALLPGMEFSAVPQTNLEDSSGWPFQVLLIRVLPPFEIWPL